MPTPLRGYQGRGYGAGIADDVRQFTEDRRDDKRFAAEEKQMGLQETQIEAKTADIGRQQETAQYDKDYELYKRDMSRGIQQFAMDGSNYQEAMDTANKFYGSDIQITHRKDPASGEVKYDFTGTTKDGEPMEKYGQTKADLGAMLNMSMHPTNWLDRYEQTNIARGVAAASAQHDIDKIDRKGMWDSINEKIKAGAKGADTGLKYQKQAWTMAASEFGTLGDDGTFTFGDTYGADYAANTAHYSATLAQHGGKKFNGDITSSNQHALTKVKSLKKVYEKKIQSENPDMEEEDQNLLVKLYVDGEVRKLTDDITSKGAASAATPEDRSRVVNENIGDIHTQMRDAKIPEADIKKAIEDNGGTYDGGATSPAEKVIEGATAGLQEATKPAEPATATEDLMAPEAEKPVEAPAAAPAEAPQQLAQAGDVGVEQAVDFGSRKKETDPNKENKSMAKAERTARSDKSMTKDIEKARKLSPAGTGKDAKPTQRLINARKEAAKRVEASFAGEGKVTSRKILEAALRSGELKESTAAAVREALGETETTMVAGQ